MFDRAANHTYEGFRRLACDPALSQHERVGFYNHYREGRQGAIMADWLRKLPNLGSTGGHVVDIGCGGGVLATAMIEHCGAAGHQLTLVDSPEMLAHLPSPAWVNKLPGCFPRDTTSFIEQNAGAVTVAIAYSVIQCVFSESSIFAFLDSCLSLLARNGEVLIGDMPNISRRNRSITAGGGAPAIEGAVTEIYPLSGHMDDSVVLALLARARSMGFDAYVLPQDPDLPLARTREDLLIRRP